MLFQDSRSGFESDHQKPQQDGLEALPVTSDHLNVAARGVSQWYQYQLLPPCPPEGVSTSRR